MEEITILRIGTDQAVRNIADLKNNINELQKSLKNTELTWEQQQAILKTLQLNQAALKDAMHATDASLEEVARAAGAANVAFDAQNQLIKDAGYSYNGLVKRMAELDQQFRSTEDAAKRMTIGAQIKSINDELTRLDADRGKFGRNVGNYKSAAEGFAEVLRAFPPTLGKTATEVKNIGTSLALVGKQPILGLVGVLAPLVIKIADGLKDNETALGAIDKLMEAMRPVADFFAGILEKIAGWLSQAVNYILELGEKSGIEFKNIVSGAVGVGNALLQFILTPIRNTIDGAKALGQVLQQVFKGQFKEAAKTAKDAVKEIGDNFKKGFDFKGNFEAGKKVGEEFAAGLKSTKRNAKDAGQQVAEEATKPLLRAWDYMQKMIKAREDMMAQWTKENEEIVQAETDTIGAELQAWLDEMEAAQWAEIEAEKDADNKRKELQQARIQAAFGYANALSSVLGSIADMYESNGEEDEEATKKAKALRTASAIVSTISGAVSAYMNTIESIKIPQVAIPLAVANAASVLAAGMAQVKQINAVKVGSGTGGSAAVSAPAPVFAPAVVRSQNITGMNEEERLNRMASNQRVYLVYSDLEIANTGQRVKVRETEF